MEATEWLFAVWRAESEKKANWQKKTEGGRGRKCLTGSEVRVNEKETVEEKTSLGVRNVLKMIFKTNHNDSRCFRQDYLSLTSFLKTNEIRYILSKEKGVII